jgi:hypothetical protein
MAGRCPVAKVDRERDAENASDTAALLPLYWLAVRRNRAQRAACLAPTTVRARVVVGQTVSDRHISGYEGRART